MIDLSLSRITTLISRLPTPLTWKYVHVAGTNGKGSVCAYLTSVLSASKISSGRFTSPHLIHRWDCISIDGKPITEHKFLTAEEAVKKIDKELNLGSTEFEILTATAFEVFRREEVDVAVVEVGMGGARDSTNALPHAPVVGVVTRIARDHENFLGEGLLNIAREKAGIAKKGAPMVVDAMNGEEIVGVISEIVKEKEGGSVVLAEAEVNDGRVFVQTERFGKLDFGIRKGVRYQHANLASATKALDFLSREFPSITKDTIIRGVAETTWPGRLQWLKIRTPEGRETELLIDGAHNEQGAEGLAEYVSQSIRKAERSVSWIVGMTAGKKLDSILGTLLRPGDSITTVGFGAVDGMPWIKCVPPVDLAQAAKNKLGDVEVNQFDSICDSALEAASKDGNSTVVLAGSLYLIGELMGKYTPGSDGIITISSQNIPQ